MKKIFITFLLLFVLANSSHAQVTEAQATKDLMGLGLPAAQASYIADIAAGGIKPSQSLIPSADNTYDLGSALVGWRSVYADTSVLTPLLIPPGDLVIRVDADAQRLHTIGASSDTALTYTFGDAGVTATQIFTLLASTSDADDDATIQIGFTSGTRGAGITLPGEEVAGGSDATYNVGAGDAHQFNINGSRVTTMDASGIFATGASSDIGFDTSGATISIEEATAGAKCMGNATANGATGTTVSTTCVEATSRVLLTRTSAPSGTAQCFVDPAAYVAGTSFVLDCDGAETGTFNWFILHET